jgi:hypothetical protein
MVQGMSIGPQCRATLAAAGFALMAAGAAVAAPPAVGDTYVYRIINGYNHEVRGHVRYRVDATDAERMTVTVTPDAPSLGSPSTRRYTLGGNWLRHPVINHDQPVDYEFSPAFPAYEMPLDTGKTWSVRVNATEPVSGRRASVRVDGAVTGNERITVPAGTFDTIKVRRYVFADDAEGFRQPTTIVETDWYAPALGRAVRSETKSEYIDLARGRSKGSQWTRGDWTVMELTEVNAAKP